MLLRYFLLFFASKNYLKSVFVKDILELWIVERAGNVINKKTDSK